VNSFRLDYRTQVIGRESSVKLQHLLNIQISVPLHRMDFILKRFILAVKCCATHRLKLLDGRYFLVLVIVCYLASSLFTWYHHM